LFGFGAQVQSPAKGFVALWKDLDCFDGRQLCTWPSLAKHGLVTVLCSIAQKFRLAESEKKSKKAQAKSELGSIYVH
jgi:hypothetical protein